MKDEQDSIHWEFLSFCFFSPGKFLYRYETVLKIGKNEIKILRNKILSIFTAPENKNYKSNITLCTNLLLHSGLIEGLSSGLMHKA